MMNRSPPMAFTLIELLISVAIGVAIVSATWGAFAQVRNTTMRSKAAAVLHQDAAIIAQNFETALSSCFHGAQVRLAIVNPGDANSAMLTLDVMRSSEDINPSFARSRPGTTFSYDLVWERFRYYAKDINGRSALYRASSTGPWTITGRTPLRRLSTIQMQADPFDGARSVPLWINEDIVVGSTATINTPSVKVGPEVRRDRRRSMIDNDLRLWPNIPSSLWLGFTTIDGTNRVTTAISDDERLDRNLSLISDKLSGFRIELVDNQGMLTTADPLDASGIAYTGHDGSAISLPNAPLFPEPHVWSNTLRVVDGLWTDGRSTPSPVYPGIPPPADERPVLVRVAFTITDQQSVIMDPDHPIERTFSFTFSTSPMSVIP
jgi:Tfp pilus assembly protein PilE